MGEIIPKVASTSTYCKSYNKEKLLWEYSAVHTTSGRE